jgi:DNA helicase-2/ATP-dependent DNA helicase PcrA
VSFFERREIKDVIAYLRLLANPAADSAFERVVNVPARGIGDTTVDRLRAAARAHGTDLLAAARLAGRGEVAGLGSPARKKLQSFVELIDGLGDVIANGASVAETIIQVIERSGIRAKLEADQSTESRDRLDNLAELVTTASDFDDEVPPAPGASLTGLVAAGNGAGDAEVEGDRDPDRDDPEPGPPTIEDFLERIALSSPSDQGAHEQVMLMTIHIAKGLEWPVVFLTGMEDGLFPSLREREGVSEDAALEEERRLAYVAVTRARERLVLSQARTRRVWGEIRIQDPSRFLDDLPADSLAQPRRARISVPAPRIVDGDWAGRARRPRPARSRDELDQRTADDDEPVFQVDGAGGFVIGAEVSHAALGAGRVVAITGTGKDCRVVVDFAAVGRKTVFAKFLEHGAGDRLN